MDHHLTPSSIKEPARSFSFPNGALKRHNPHRPRSPPAAYRECLKNHAASLGGHSLDGCGEFMPIPLASPSDPTSLRCAACGCHRNFHRRHDDPLPHDPAADYATTGDLIPKRRSSSSASPPQTAPPAIPSSYFPSAPHMLLALSSGLAPGPAQSTATAARKRFRTKFSREQKEKMFIFAEKLGWRMQKQDEGVVEEFCNEIGVAKGVLKVWMHNNKHTFGKKEQSVGAGSDINNGDDSGIDNNKSNGTHALNGSSSSS